MIHFDPQVWRWTLVGLRALSVCDLLNLWQLQYYYHVLPPSPQ